MSSNLESYEISKGRGFLPENDPLRALDPHYEAWEAIGADLPKLLMTTKLKRNVTMMPTLGLDKLKTRAEQERAMMLLSFIGHAYVWGEKNPAEVIPPSLAIPWYELSKILGRPPVLSYASYALHNWKRIDQQAPIELGNIALIQNFLGGMDEEWFILIHVDIEAKAAAAVTSLISLQLAASAGNPAEVEKALEKIDSALGAMYPSLERMTDHCDPYIYYHRVRPYIHGWKNHPILKDGLIYEGVAAYSGKPQQFRGETGSQSSIVPALDAALRITHKDDPLRAYLNEMKDYMPPRHRAFIDMLEQGPNVREWIDNSGNSTIKDLYNSAVEWIHKFRALHLQYAISYIEQQKQTNASNPSKVGTGGTPFVEYLKKHRDETAAHKV